MYSEVASDQFIRAKFHVYATGQADPNNQNQIPNLRIRILSRFAFSSQLEVLHHTDYDVGGTSFSRDLTPSRDPANPSIYRVDLDPPELPYLTGNTSEGLQRMFEVYATGGDPHANGTLALTESSIGSYAAPNTSSTDPSVLIKTYSTATDFSRIYYDLRQYSRGNLMLLGANINGNNSGGTFGGFSWTGVPWDEISATANPGGVPGVTLSTAGTSDTILATAALDWPEGNAQDVDHTLRARVEENKQYIVRFHARAEGASSDNALLRFRVRTAKFNYTQRLEVGGAWNLSSGAARDPDKPTHILARQYLPGTGGWMDGNPSGAIYDVIVNTPLSRDIRPDVAGTIEQRMPHLAMEDGPGAGPATRAQASRRDLFPAVDIIDSLSGAYWQTGSADPQEKGNVTVDRVEIRKYDLIAD